MQINRLSRLVLLLLFMTLTGCGDSDSPHDLANFVKKMQQLRIESKKSAQPATSKIPEATTYRASKTKEPFHLGSTGISKTVTNTNSLRAYPIPMLRFVGTVSKHKTNYAYVIAPDNMIYQIKEGDIIGDQHGKVMHIFIDRIDIMEEETSEESGQPIKRVITLQLKE